MGHPSGDGNYHYHIMTPCLFNVGASYASNVCPIEKECAANVFSWSLKGYDSRTPKNTYVTGITVDGHPLFGPYDDTGSVRDCGKLDACNGILQSNGSYAYYLTKNFPYGPGCFGPIDPSASYTASCTGNACISTSTSNSSSNSTGGNGGDSAAIYSLISMFSIIVPLIYSLI